MAAINRRPDQAKADDLDPPEHATGGTGTRRATYLFPRQPPPPPPKPQSTPKRKTSHAEEEGTVALYGEIRDLRWSWLVALAACVLLCTPRIGEPVRATSCSPPMTRSETSCCCQLTMNKERYGVEKKKKSL